MRCDPRWRWLAASESLLVVLLTAGCGGSSANARADGGVTGWLAYESPQLLYISMTERNGVVSGRLDAATAEDEDLTTRSFTLAGVHQGRSVSLTLDGVTTATGTLDGGEFTLTLPGADGALSSFVLHRGTSASYNRALDELRAMTTNAQQARQAQQAADAAERLRQQGVKKLTEALTRLRESSAGAAHDYYVDAWANYDSSLDRLRAADAHVAELVRGEAACGDIESAIGDAESAHGDVESAHGDFESFDGDAERTERDLASDSEAVLEASGAVAADDRPADFAEVMNQASAAQSAVARLRTDAATKAAGLDRVADSVLATAGGRLPSTCS